MNGRKGLSQEGLKVIACVTMLLDHIGAVFVPGYGLRIIGRLAFPIYCFLLAEGMAHTRDVRKYGLRLAIGALLSEIPFDLLFFGGFTWGHQSVMVTLLLGYGMTLWVRRTPRLGLVAVIVCALAADVMNTDYGAMGVMMIALFTWTRELEDRVGWQAVGLAVLGWLTGGMGWQIGAVHIPIQLFGVLAMVPICLYSGRKGTSSRAVQWGFYLFYPVHLALLVIAEML